MANRPQITNTAYWSKTEAELRYIIRDAGEAARAMRDIDAKAEGKYLDQVNDACTVLRTIAEERRVVAVNRAIEQSNRSGRRIGGREARAIHRLLAGRA